MRLISLHFRQFRNILDLEIKPKEGLNLFVGDNAQGKTSILEGIFFLSTLKSFRTTHAQDMIQLGTEGFLIEGKFNFQSKDTLTLKARLEKQERSFLVNEKVTTATKFIGQLRSVIFSPESLAAVKSGPDLRRQLIDQATFQLSSKAPGAQREFSKALRQRNALLKQIRDTVILKQKGELLLESLDELYLQVASEVIFERLRFLKEIFPAFKETLSQIIGEKCQPKFQYQSGEVQWNETTSEEIEDRLRNELKNMTRRSTEMSLGNTITGPHRHDVAFLFNGNDSRIFCSQGQQRALILAFKISEIMYHKKVFESYPLLLLDDVFSEFDEKKRHFLIDFLRSKDAQTFLTTTEETEALRGNNVFELRGGKIIS